MRADIHDGQEHKRSIHVPDTEAQDQSLHPLHLACNTRPVHTVGSSATVLLGRLIRPVIGALQTRVDIVRGR
jgi:hypothetical protein